MNPSPFLRKVTERVRVMKNFLSGCSNGRIRFVWQGSFIIFLRVVLSACIVCLFGQGQARAADAAVVLEDEGLERVCAEGVSETAVQDALEPGGGAVPQAGRESSPTQSPGALLAGNSGSNVVMVDDYAQQHLSSLVNVNAAGSVVPVLINIVININSTVDVLSNTNTLNLNNYVNSIGNM
jgi:hypothetical protein